ncbi:Piwi-domain-containing protein [Peniophora sp. CONT]|nr:Piwi-domain-containing protein [Peniophora sp. CONT]
MALSRPRYPHGQRPYGTLGRPGFVTVNAFAITQKKPLDFYIYDVSIAQKGKPNIPDLLTKTADNRIPMNSQRAHEIIDKMKAMYQVPWASMTAAYDGRKLLVSNRSMPTNPTQFPVNMSPKDMNDPKNTSVFVVTISMALTVNGGSFNKLINGSGEDDDSKAFIQALQLLLRMAPILSTSAGGTPHNSRSVYTPAGKKLDQSSGGIFELWRGIFQSVRPSIGRLIVNVDTVAAFIYTPGIRVVDFIAKSLNIRDARDLNRMNENSDEWRMVKTLVKRMLVEVTVPPPRRGIPNRRKPIRDVVVDIKAFTFDWDRGPNQSERVSVYDYFVEVHHVTPQIKLGLQFGSNNRPVVVPAEFCIVAAGQILRRALTPRQTQDMLDFTKTKPHERLGQIKQVVNGPFLNYAQSPYIQQTGLQISVEPIQANSRMLDRPGIQFANPRNPAKPVMVTPQPDTSWRVVNQIFINTRRSCWAVVNFSEARSDQVMQVARELQQRCVARGMDVQGLTEPVVVGNNQNPRQAMYSALAQYHAGEQNAPPVSGMMVLVVLPRNNAGGEQRKAVKFWGDCETGVVTQCMKQEKVVQQGNQIDQYCNNMAIKINAKLGGTNSLPLSKHVTDMLHGGRFMVFGADVGHPGPSVTDRPSICALTASIDADATRFISRAFIQHPRQETMDPTKLEDMVYDCILACAQRNNAVPANFLFYRDGVSEGEFEKVSHFEIPAIEKAWIRFWHDNLENMQRGKVKFVPTDVKKGWHPPLKLTFVVVGKRHHIKLFPGQGGQSDRSGNVPGGTVVDRDIVAPTSLDFYLQSHGGLLGTSRSSHYTVLANTTGSGQGMSIDDLQAVSHYLCYAYARATRAVSIPAPVYYADLICARARFHLNDNGQTFSDGGSGDFNEQYWTSIFKEVHEGQRNRPFFM